MVTGDKQWYGVFGSVSHTPDLAPDTRVGTCACVHS